LSRVQASKNKPRKRRKYRIIVASLLLLSIIGVFIYFQYPFANREYKETVTNEQPIIYQNKEYTLPWIQKESIYVPLTFLQEHIDDGLFYDESTKSIILTTSKEVIQMPSESLTIFVNEEPVQLNFSVFHEENGQMYMALEPLLNYYAINYELLPNSQVLMIYDKNETINYAKVTTEKTNEELLRLRVDQSIKSPYTAQLTPDETVLVIDENDTHYFVRSFDGRAGYIEKTYVTKTDTILIETVEPAERKSLAIDEKINLTWEAVYSKNPDTSKLPKMDGVNVISPTWFEVGSPDGTLKNMGSLQFTKWAHDNDMLVWGLFSNAFDPELTNQTFSKYETRKYMIKQLLYFSEIYELDGINIDIENVNLEDGPYITQFVREAMPYFHEAGLTVSMDVTFLSTSGNWSMFYEREKLAELVDYIMVMAYDQHPGSSKVAGSVASIPWVESNLQRILEVIPNDMLVLGVPLYTRLWQTDETGKVTSKAYSMAAINNWLEEHNLTPEFDEATGQNYAEYYDEKEKITYSVWLEDGISLTKRLELAKKYDLAGVAAWSRFFADNNAWAYLDINGKLTAEVDGN